MLTTLLLAAVQAAAPTPPARPAPGTGSRTIVREIVINEHPAAKDGKGKEERREILIIRGDDRTAATGEASDKRIRIVDVDPGKSGERRTIRVLPEPGAPGTRIAMVDCDASNRLDAETTDKDGKKTRVMVCAKGGNPVEALERASKRVAQSKDVPEDVRTRVVAQMEAQIAQLKATR